MAVNGTNIELAQYDQAMTVLRQASRPVTLVFYPTDLTPDAFEPEPEPEPQPEPLLEDTHTKPQPEPEPETLVRQELARDDEHPKAAMIALIEKHAAQSLKTPAQTPAQAPEAPPRFPSPPAVPPRQSSDSKGGKQLTRTQCHEMVRIQLEIDGLDPNVTDDWIDSLFDEFDADGSGTVDDAEWDLLVARMREMPQESGKQLTRTQCHEMVRIQLEIDGLDPNVTDDWIDSLFDEFDADGSGTVDDAEWDLLVARMREIAK